MQDKKAFILYADLISTVEELPDVTAGKLFKIILRFVNDQHPEINDLLLKIAFEPIKLQLERDLEKWKARAEKSRNNGAKGGRPPKTQKTQQDKNKPKKPSRLNNNLQDKNKPVTDTDTVTVTGTGIVTDTIENRVAEFKNSLRPFIEKYGVDMLEKFFIYWTQINKGGRKLHFEKQKTFQLANRLASWKSRETSSKYPEKKTATKSVVETAIERGESAKEILNELYKENE